MRRNDDPIYLILPKHRQVFLFPDAIADGIAEEDSISLLIEFSFDALNDLCKNGCETSGIKTPTQFVFCEYKLLAIWFG